MFVHDHKTESGTEEISDEHFGPISEGPVVDLPHTAP
jgi:hypothetical protein